MRAERGLTVLEMLIVVAIVSLMVGLTFPSVGAGLESLRLRSAADSTASFLTLAMTRVESSQEPVELIIHRAGGVFELYSTDPKFARQMHLGAGLSISRILPEAPDAGEETPRSFLLLPGESLPRIAIELANARLQRRLVRIDPLTASAIVEIPAEDVSTVER